MAMALTSKNKHYHWYNVQRRFFLTTAKAANYSIKKAEQLLDEMLEAVDYVIVEVSTRLPKKFPTSIAEAIFEGMRLTKRKLLK